MQGCRGGRGSARLQVQRFRGADANADAGKEQGAEQVRSSKQVQSRCKGAEVQSGTKVVQVQVEVEVQVQVQRCRGAEVQWCLDGGAEAHQVQMLY